MAFINATSVSGLNCAYKHQPFPPVLFCTLKGSSGYYGLGTIFTHIFNILYPITGWFSVVIVPIKEIAVVVFELCCYAVSHCSTAKSCPRPATSNGGVRDPGTMVFNIVALPIATLINFLGR